MAGRGKTNIQCVKQNVPKFIQDFKARAGIKGYEEPPDIDSKRMTEEQVADDEEEGVHDGEMPTICVADNVTEAEVADFIKKEFKPVDKGKLSNKRGHEDDASSGKIVFKKPTKEKDTRSPSDPNTSQKKKKSKMKKVNDKKLLSFDEDEEEET